MGDHLQITINGEIRQVAKGTTLAALLAQLGFDDRPVAVERNRDVVPRASHTTCELEDGDSLEVVTFVGGG